MAQVRVGWYRQKNGRTLPFKEWSYHTPVQKAWGTVPRRITAVSQKMVSHNVLWTNTSPIPSVFKTYLKARVAKHSSITWHLLSCLTVRVICPAINTGIFCTTNAGIRSPQFSFVPVNKPSFFNFSFWMQSSIAATIVCRTCSRTIISILYYTDQSISGYVKFFMINVSSFQYGYYNCINISYFLFILPHKSIKFAQWSLFHFNPNVQIQGNNISDGWFFFLSIYLSFHAFSSVFHFSIFFTFLWSFKYPHCISVSCFHPVLKLTFL